MKTTKKPDLIYSKIAIHPGEVLKDEIEARELSKSDTAYKLGMQPGNLSELFKGKRNITAGLALKLEDLLGISAEFWLNLQNSYEITILRNQRKKSKELAY
jgi:HTH-type transcriptional regulator/antitoxin HigA